MNELKRIKQEILKYDYVPKLLESMGCKISNTSNDVRIEASRPNGDNRRSVQVYLNENLTSRVRSRSHIPIRDIYDLVSYLVYDKKTIDEFDKNIFKTKNYIVKTLNLKNFDKKNNIGLKQDPNAWLKKIQKRKKKRIYLSEIQPNETFPESILNQFIMAPHIDWINDGIPYYIQKEFDVGFDLKTERIIFPIRNKDGMIIGIKGRATRKEDEEDFKYIALYSFRKSIELYNLHKALPYIKQKKEIILVESEKSVMKLWHMGYKNSVSQMGSEISEVQAEIIKRIDPDIKIVLAYDKDKTVQEIKQYAQVFEKKENVYSVYDTKDLLNDKDAPVDVDKETWETLYNECCYKVFPT